jgi:hypothetical protein
MKKLLFILISVACLLCATTASAQVTYTTKMTSGPFIVAPSAATVDWMVTNNDSVPVDVRISVYHHQFDGSPKVSCCPGPLVITMAPGSTTHNANGVGSVFNAGSVYEVVIEATSILVHPNVNQWSTNGSSGFIPETLIPSGDFVTISLGILDESPVSGKVKGPKR